MAIPGNEVMARAATRPRRAGGPGLERVLAILQRAGSHVATIRIHPDGALQIDLATQPASAGVLSSAGADDPMLTAWAAEQGIAL